MTKPTARKTDSVSHGGIIITGSTDVLTNNLPTARVGDLVDCKDHGIVSIVTGSATLRTNGRQTARVGDLTSCGASIITGSPNRRIGSNSSTASNSAIPSFQGYDYWAPPIDVATHITEEHLSGPLRADQTDALARAQIKPEQTNPDSPAPDVTSLPPITPPTVGKIPTDCTDISAKTSFESAFQLSTNFVLGSVSSNAALAKETVVAQAGLTTSQIVCNLRGVAVNVLEPLTNKYGRPTITSGFRLSDKSSDNSVHKLGQAVDLQWSGISDQDYYERAIWIRDNMQWDQIILEFGGNRPWIHVSYSSAARRSSAMTRTTIVSGYIQGIVRCTNKPGMGGIRI